MIIIGISIILGFCLIFLAQCALSIIFSFKNIRQLKHAVAPRRPKSFPIIEELHNRKIVPPSLINIKTYSQYDYYGVLFMSMGCQTCRTMLVFLKYNKNLFQKIPLLICNKTSVKELQSFLGSGPYIFIEYKDFVNQFDVKMIPIIYIVRDGNIIGKMLVNTGEDLLSIFGVYLD